MENIRFTAFIVEETRDKTFSHAVKEMSTKDLPRGEVLIRVNYSSLNYKDALSASGNRGVTRQYPHTPGGFGQYIRVPADRVVALPTGLSLEQSMILGTAGFTAAMSVERLISGVKPAQGSILVTGATGEVGSLSCAILVKLGYTVDAVSGKPDTGFLEGLGVKEALVVKGSGTVEFDDLPGIKALADGLTTAVEKLGEKNSPLCHPCKKQGPCRSHGPGKTQPCTDVCGMPNRSGPHVQRARLAIVKRS